MKIKFKKITIRELVKDYQDKGDDGIVGYDGKLDIRPPYQREFVYESDQRNAVIDTVKKTFPLNVMYWAVKKENEHSEETYEIIDGQQRTISICQFRNNEFSVPYDGYQCIFRNLSDDRQKEFLDYKLMVYLCSGTDSEKLNWFRTINIAGEKLSDQELRSAVYSGKWVTDAKRYFVKNNFEHFKYLKGIRKRQHYLETVIKWISGDKIEDYMGRNQHKEHAKELWDYFIQVIEWIESVFTVYRKQMQQIDWGFYYMEYKSQSFCPKKAEQEINRWITDDDVTNKSGVYKYYFDRKEKHLTIRPFTKSQKISAFNQQDGMCKKCGESFPIEEMHADHFKPWSKGGKTEPANCQILCADCNRRKSNI